MVRRGPRSSATGRAGRGPIGPALLCLQTMGVRVMKRRTLLQGTAGFVGGLLLPACEQHRPLLQVPTGMTESPPTIQPGLHRWAPEAREYVQALQERQYRKLAVELGLRGDPRAAFARLSTSPTPRSHVATEKLR